MGLRLRSNGLSSPTVRLRIGIGCRIYGSYNWLHSLLLTTIILLARKETNADRLCSCEIPVAQQALYERHVDSEVRCSCYLRASTYDAGDTDQGILTVCADVTTVGQLSMRATMMELS